MCTKAVSVNVRAMSEKLQVPIVSPKTKIALSSKEDSLPTDYTPVITHARPREIQFMRWGLIPASTGDPKQVKPMFNARAETLTQLPSFRDLVMASRCLILNPGFYERETQGDERVEWLINPTDEEYFYKAGLWTTWQDRLSGELIESFTMITCDPTGHSFRNIHDRMPVIMNKAERRLWMNPHATKEQLIALLKPCGVEMYSVREHSRKKVKNESLRKKPNTDNLF